jgi:hypothetical protein
MAFWTSGDTIDTTESGTRHDINRYGGAWQTFRGLHLRTHPDADKAANQIALLACSEIVLDDGCRYTGLTFPLTADITASGGGGLDTGARAASAWYEIYAIGKSSTKLASDLKLLFHRAKSVPLDQSQTTQTTNGPLRFGATTNVKEGQSFKPGVTGSLDFAEIFAFRNGAPSGRVWLTVEADSGGVPSGVALATSDKLDASVWNAGSQWVRFVFRSPATLTSATTYHLVLQGDYAISGVNYISWYYAAGGSTYANGAFYIYDGTTWSTSAAADYAFKTYIRTNDTAVTLPSGYDEKALIGYVYNSSGNVLIPFYAADKSVHRLSYAAGQLGAVTATLPTLVDLSAVVPPVPVTLLATGSNSGAVNYVALAPVPDGYGTTISGAGDLGLVYFNSPGANYGATFGQLLTDHTQGVYVSVSAGTGTVWIYGFRW